MWEYSHDGSSSDRARIEIVRLRERDNRPSGGQWAVLYDPRVRRRWVALRGKTEIQTAGTPAVLEPLIDHA